MPRGKTRARPSRLEDAPPMYLEPGGCHAAIRIRRDQPKTVQTGGGADVAAPHAGGRMLEPNERRYRVRQTHRAYDHHRARKRGNPRRYRHGLRGIYYGRFARQRVRLRVLSAAARFPRVLEDPLSIGWRVAWRRRRSDPRRRCHPNRRRRKLGHRALRLRRSEMGRRARDIHAEHVDNNPHRSTGRWIPLRPVQHQHRYRDDYTQAHPAWTVQWAACPRVLAAERVDWRWWRWWRWWWWYRRWRRRRRHVYRLPAPQRLENTLSCANGAGRATPRAV